MLPLPYGIEGFSTIRGIAKADGSQGKVEEKLDFKVVEFNKNAKKIVVSHNRTYEEDKRSADKIGTRVLKSKNQRKQPEKRNRELRKQHLVISVIWRL